jgi:hypothetical protein
MPTIHDDDKTFNGAATFNGGVTIDPASVSAANAMVPTRRYISQLITQAALTAGATCTVALTGEPTGMIPQACYVVTDEATTSSSGDTTGLTCEVGLAGDPDFLMVSTSVFGAAGRKEAYAGVGIDSYRASDALVVKFTAVGAGSEDCADISNLNLRVVILYCPVSAEA